MTLFYLGFSVETYSPVTRRSIESFAAYECSIDSDAPVVRALRELVRAAPQGEFRGNFVRLKIVGMEALPVFVDAMGGIVIGDADSEKVAEKKLASDSFEQLAAIVEALARSAKCRRTVFYPRR